MAKFAISSTSPSLPTGKFLMASFVQCPEGSNLEKAPSVYIGPGAIQFILIPLRPHSTPSDLKENAYMYTLVNGELIPFVNFFSEVCLNFRLNIFITYFIIVSTPDFAHALGTTYADPS